MERARKIDEKKTEIEKAVPNKKGARLVGPCKSKCVKI